MPPDRKSNVKAPAAIHASASQDGLHCAVCGSANNSETFKALGVDHAKEDFSVRYCGSCGLGWTYPVVSDGEIGKWYPPAYYGKGNVRFNILIETLVRFLGRRRARAIARWAPIGPVLDVGCGRGFTLLTLRDFGYAPHGVELSETSAWHAKNRLNIDVHVGDFMSAPYKPEQFNAIIFWHSLEHFRLPAEAVRHAHKLLKPGGLLVVAVPNSESLQARLFGASWFHLDVPRHYFHFGTKNLHALLDQSGFGIVRTAHFSFEQNPYGWVQTMFNAMGMEFNFLYSILKNRTARIVPIRNHPIQVLITLALLPVFIPLAIIFTVVEAAVRRGGTIEVYALKR